MNELTFNYVWNQKKIPVAWRQTGKGEHLLVKLPYAGDNRKWIQNGRGDLLKWLPKEKYWELPKTWFNDFVDRSLARYGKVYIIQPYRKQEKCAPACQKAKGHECQCSCLGRHHGTGSDGSWFEVSDAFSTRWGEKELAIRLLTARLDLTEGALCQ